METYKKTIELNFSREDFEELYFRNNQDSFILSPILKRDFVLFVFFLLLFFSSVIYSYLTSQHAWVIVITAIITVVMFIPYFIKVLRLKKWRNSVFELIQSNEKYKKHNLLLTECALTLIQDGKEEITKWSSFTKAEINTEYVILTGDSGYIFPKKSMTDDDYDYLTEKIKLHLNTDQ